MNKIKKEKVSSLLDTELRKTKKSYKLKSIKKYLLNEQQLKLRDHIVNIYDRNEGTVNAHIILLPSTLEKLAYIRQYFNFSSKEVLATRFVEHNEANPENRIIWRSVDKRTMFAVIVEMFIEQNPELFKIPPRRF
jgi:hypothetical protein